jgi:hypothetical protein
MKKILMFGAMGGDVGHRFIEYFKENYKGPDYEIVASGTRNTKQFKKMGGKNVLVFIHCPPNGINGWFQAKL